MTLYDLPDYVTPDDLAPFGIRPDDVRRRCPLATEYGTTCDPSWHRDDLAPLLAPPDEEDVP